MPNIAFLPTGDWAEVEDLNDVAVISVTDEHLTWLSNFEVSQRMAGQLSMCNSESEVEFLIAGWNE